MIPFNPVHCPPHCCECSPSRPGEHSQWPLLSEKLGDQGTWRDTCVIKQEEEEADSAFCNYAIARYFDTVFQGSVLKRKKKLIGHDLNQKSRKDSLPVELVRQPRLSARVVTPGRDTKENQNENMHVQLPLIID